MRKIETIKAEIEEMRKNISNWVIEDINNYQALKAELEAAEKAVAIANGKASTVVTVKIPEWATGKELLAHHVKTAGITIEENPVNFKEVGGLFYLIKVSNQDLVDSLLKDGMPIELLINNKLALEVDPIYKLTYGQPYLVNGKEAVIRVHKKSGLIVIVNLIDKTVSQYTYKPSNK